MRAATIAASVLVFALAGGTCLPLVDNTRRTAAEGTTRAIDITEPSEAAVVSAGDVVQINWAASNLSGEPGTVRLSAESRLDLTRRVLVENLALNGTGGSGEFSWDTTGFDGPYAVVAELVTTSRTVEDVAGAIITVDVAPVFTWSAPASDETFTTGETPERPITLSWTVRDRNATVRIGLDEDADHGEFTNDPNDTSRNEIVLVERDVDASTTDDTFSFTGTDSAGTAVPEGRYFVFAIVNDGQNDDVVAEAAGRVRVVAAEPNEPATETTFTDPNDDTTFLTTTPTLPVSVDVVQTQDVLVDLKVDTDDNHQNGNEQTILSQRFVEAGDETVRFDWNGNTTASVAVAAGIYRLLAVVNSGGASPTIVESPGFVFRRSAAELPLIALLEPAARQEVQAGAFVNIRWRDELGDVGASEQTGVTVRIVLDEDGSAATTGDQIEILTGRDAAGDGVRDSFSWQVPDGLLDVGVEYTIIAFIDRDGAAPFDSSSSAAGKVTIPDPAAP